MSDCPHSLFLVAIDGDLRRLAEATALGGSVCLAALSPTAGRPSKRLWAARRRLH